LIQSKITCTIKVLTSKPRFFLNIAPLHLFRATQDENRYAESKMVDSSEPKLDNRESPLKPNSNQDSALVKAGSKVKDKTICNRPYDMYIMFLLFYN